MKSIKYILLGMMALFIGHVQAQTTRTSIDDLPTINNMNKVDQVGVGLELGSLSGVTVDYWHSSAATWNASLLADSGNTAIALAHEWMFPAAASRVSNVVLPYIGAGALMAFGNHSDYFSDRSQTFALALQVPLGIQFLPPHQRFGIFAEIKPSLEITPATVAFFNADLGARFYF
jgi:hypothetical protein